MSEAIVFIIGAISGIFIISHFTKINLDEIDQRKESTFQQTVYGHTELKKTPEMKQKTDIRDSATVENS